MMVNIYPFYGQVNISGAWSNLANAYKMFVNRFPGKQVSVGETGWPSVGPASGAAVPNIANEQTCITQILANGSQLGPIFLFEAFDEPWKYENPWGPHWGLWDKNGNPKFTFNTSLTRDVSWAADLNGNQVAEAAVLGQSLEKGTTQVDLKDGQTGATITSLTFFGLGWTPVAVAMLNDLNANRSQEIAVLAFHEGTGKVQVEIRDVKTRVLIRRINFIAGVKPKELTVRSNNLIAVSGTDPVKGVSQIEVRSALNGSLVKLIRWGNEMY
jgi:hypothetical protein